MHSVMELSEHRTSAFGAGRSTEIDDLRVVLRARRDGRERRLLLRRRQLLRLVVDEHVVGASTGEGVGSRREADHAAVREVDGLLAVRLADGLEEGVELGLVLVLERCGEGLEHLVRGVPVLACVEHLLACRDDAVEHAGTHVPALAVLTRHGEGEGVVEVLVPLVPREHGVEDVRLPRDGLAEEGCREPCRVRAVRH